MLKWIAKLLFLGTFMVATKGTSQEADKWTMPTRPVAVIETSSGSMEVVLYPDIAPLACENFIRLAESGYYNGVSFHRIIPGFMIQGGDPTGTGAGGKSIFGPKFADEFSDQVSFDMPGVLAMANAGPNTNGSQFFITTAETAWLNQKHTIFGQVIKNLKAVKKLESYGSNSGRVSSPQTITRIYLKPS